MKSLLSFLLIFLFCTLFVRFVDADEYSDLEKKLNQKNSQYSASQKTLEQLKKDVAYLSGAIGGTQAELEGATAKLASAKKELEALESVLDKKQKTLAYLLNIRNRQIRAMYINPGLNPLELIFASEKFSRIPELAQYQKEALLDSEQLVKAINEEAANYKKTQGDMLIVKADLEAASAALQARVNAQKQSLAGAQVRQASVSRGLDTIKSEITQALIRKAELDEQRRAGNFSGAPPVPITPGAGKTTYYFFYGIGRYSHMGHGVGMSQWGAYGYAKNRGWGAGQILKKYYTGSSLSSYTQPATIKVRVYASCTSDRFLREEIMGFNTYLKGIEELLSAWVNNSSLIELSKAQAIAARTYAIRQIQGKGWVHSNTRDQCWTGNTGRANWNRAVDETNGLVLTAGGGLVNTLYSASHGGHSEHNENVFQGWTGNGYQGYPQSYLRGVSDRDSGGVGPSDNFGWNTKYSYTIGQIREILRRQGLTAAENSWIDRNVGTLTSLGIERGVSGRVAWVNLYGTKGSARIPGMVFRASFNSFPASGPPVNGDDVMFSVNFSIGTQVR